MLHKPHEPFFAGAQRVLGVPAFRDVAEIDHNRADRCILEQVRAHTLDPDRDAVFALYTRFERYYLTRAGHHLREPLSHDRFRLGVDQFNAVAPNQFLRAVSKNAFAGRADIADDALSVHETDGV